MSWDEYNPPDWKEQLKARLPLIGVGVLAVALIVGAIGLASGTTADEPEAPPPTTVQPAPAAPETTQPSNTTTSTSIPGPEQSLHPDATDGERSAALNVAVRFIQAWARPDLPQSQWLAGIEPYVTPQALENFGTTDPRNVPSTAVVDNARIQAISAFGAIIDVPTDAGEIRVTLDTLDGSPLVTSIEPVGLGPSAGPSPG